jgi:uncharacterized protein YjlB
MPPSRVTEPTTLMFADDGSVPNNPKLPLLLYRNAIDLIGTSEPESRVEHMFRANGWSNGIWRNGVYPYVHYHSMIHEGMGVARGRAKVRFGGAGGREIDLSSGDVVVLPAGTGHQCLWHTIDLMVIGAYPRSGQYDLCRGSKAERDKAVAAIPNVPLPESDPVYGKQGPLMRLWRE